MGFLSFAVSKSCSVLEVLELDEDRNFFISMEIFHFIFSLIK